MKRRSSDTRNVAFTHEPPVQVIEPGQWQEIHLRSLATSVALSRYYVKGFITPEAVIDVLNKAKVRFLLVGAHMIGGWTNRPRTTEDVDILVGARHLRRAVRALTNAYPRLVVLDTPVVVRFKEPRTVKVVIAVMKSNQSLFQVALRHTHQVTTTRREYYIPSLEFALAMKFAAMVSPFREKLRKMQDAVDFASIVVANRQIDLNSISRLGDRVYARGGKEILEMVRRVRAGKRLNL